MSDTPRTDDALARSGGLLDMTNFARELERENATIMAALKEASDHLDYCGYGDRWERECAAASGLMEQITEALSLANHRIGHTEK